MKALPQLFFMLLTVGSVQAQALNQGGSRESLDPARAAEVEQRGRALSGQPLATPSATPGSNAIPTDSAGGAARGTSQGATGGPANCAVEGSPSGASTGASTGASAGAPEGASNNSPMGSDPGRLPDLPQMPGAEGISPNTQDQRFPEATQPIR